MMKKIIKGALIIAVILMLNAKTLQAEEVTSPQKAAEGQKINPLFFCERDFAFAAYTFSTSAVPNARETALME